MGGPVEAVVEWIDASSETTRTVGGKLCSSTISSSSRRQLQLGSLYIPTQLRDGGCHEPSPDTPDTAITWSWSFKVRVVSDPLVCLSAFFIRAIRISKPANQTRPPSKSPQESVVPRLLDLRLRTPISRYFTGTGLWN